MAAPLAAVAIPPFASTSCVLPGSALRPPPAWLSSCLPVFLSSVGGDQSFYYRNHVNLIDRLLYGVLPSDPLIDLSAWRTEIQSFCHLTCASCRTVADDDALILSVPCPCTLFYRTAPDPRWLAGGLLFSQQLHRQRTFAAWWLRKSLLTSHPPVLGAGSELLLFRAYVTQVASFIGCLPLRLRAASCFSHWASVAHNSVLSGPTPPLDHSAPCPSRDDLAGVVARVTASFSDPRCVGFTGAPLTLSSAVDYGRTCDTPGECLDTLAKLLHLLGIVIARYEVLRGQRNRDRRKKNSEVEKAIRSYAVDCATRLLAFSLPDSRSPPAASPCASCSPWLSLSSLASEVATNPATPSVAPQSEVVAEMEDKENKDPVVPSPVCFVNPVCEVGLAAGTPTGKCKALLDRAKNQKRAREWASPYPARYKSRILCLLPDVPPPTPPSGMT